MNILSEVEDSVITFVKERVPSHKWSSLIHRFAIEREMEDDDITELKDFVFDLVMDSLRWSSIVSDIQSSIEDTEDEEEEELGNNDRDW